MAANLPSAASPSTSNNLFAAVDMGTNSFKLLIVRADPTTGRFLSLDRVKFPVLLGRDVPSSSAISSATQLRAIAALREFQLLLRSHRVSPSHTRLVATSAVREASNQSEFLNAIQQLLGLDVTALSGEEEARLTYVGVLQFHPIFDKKALIIDIGGGSTEFVIGKEGEFVCGISLQLGHVTLTEEFVKKNEIQTMREHIRNVIHQSRLVDKISEYGFDVVIGSSGTIRAIEKAIFHGYGMGLIDNLWLFEGCKRDWKFSREELNYLVGRLCAEEGDIELKVEREGFFKRRSEFILAGAVLLEEIFEMIGIDEIEVSGYSLGEGVIAEKVAGVFNNCDLNANARWRCVVRLASRFNSKKKMKSAALCADIAKEMYGSIRKWNEIGDGKYKLAVSLDDKDLEYLEAACLLHGIGLITGKKGYHKQSYHIIMNCGHLHGYDSEEVKIIALLAKHHRKKFPKLDHHSLEGFMKETKQKFRILGAIARVSIAVQQYLSVNVQDIQVSSSQQGFKLVLSELKGQPMVPGNVLPSSGDNEGKLMRELEHFRMVFHQKLMVIGPSSSLES